MGADGSEQGPPCGSSSLCPGAQGEAPLHDCHPGLTGANVPRGGSCIRPGLWDCPQETPASSGALLVPANTLPAAPPQGPRRQRQELAAHPACVQEPRCAQHNLSLAGEVTASFACRELPTLLGISALGPGTDGASCSWRRRSSLPGAEPSAWQGQPHLLGRRQKLGNLPAFAAFRLAASHGGSKRVRVFAQREKR